jgi:hypothetical protein
MTAAVEQLHSQILELSLEDRAKLTELLLASFEPQAEIQNAWLVEASRRRDEVIAGTVAMLDGDEVIRSIRARIS